MTAKKVIKKTPEKKVEKQPEKINLEFIIEKKSLTSRNFNLNYEGIRQKFKNFFTKQKLGFKIIFKYLHLKFALLYLFLLRKWVIYCKFCYSINLRRVKNA